MTKPARHAVEPGIMTVKTHDRRNEATAELRPFGQSGLPELDWALLLPGGALLALTALMLAAVIHPHF